MFYFLDCFIDGLGCVCSYGPASLDDINYIKRAVDNAFHGTKITTETECRGLPLPRDQWPV